jgi:hypothetical protein
MRVDRYVTHTAQVLSLLTCVCTSTYSSCWSMKSSEHRAFRLHVRVLGFSTQSSLSTVSLNGSFSLGEWEVEMSVLWTMYVRACARVR